jgi:gliding motility-associated-like protein
MKYLNRISLLLFTMWTISAVAQPTVTTGLTLEEYVNDILLGSGVQAFNIQFTGDPVQLGYLEGVDPAAFPLEAGLVLSSAYSENIATCGFEDVPFGSGVSGDQDLLNIANSVPGMIGQNFNVGSVNDLCILEFDFVATGDTVKFNYIFGSDEYLTWINSSFNDIFAFFLSGPGITGPYDSPAGFPDGAINIAQVPNTNPPLPITISSVNPGINAQYYNDNPNNDEICINGYTIKLEALGEVICGETYHIKLAIADGSDTALESIVILEAGSFTSNSVVQVDLSIDVGGPDADTMYEDCGIATLTFTRPIDTLIDIEEMIVIEYQGTAINGVDYSLLPDTVIFAPGVQSVSFEVDAFEDGLAEGTEEVIFEILNLAACNGDGLTSYFQFFISDEPEPLVVTGYTTEMCQGADLEIEPIIEGGYGNFTYDWSTGETDPSIFVSPGATTTYNVIVSDTCGMPSDDADILVNLLIFPPLEVNILNGDLLLECNGFETVTGSAVGGDGAYEWAWEDQDGNNLFGFGNTLWYNAWQGADQIVLTVTDGCGFEESSTINVAINAPAIVIDFEGPLSVLCNANFTINPNASGGSGGLNYTWTQGFNFLGFNPTLTTSTSSDMTITLNVSDFCGQSEEIDIDIEVESPPITINMPLELTGPCTEVFEIVAFTDGGSGGGSYQWFADGALEATGNNVSNITPLNFQSFQDALISLTVTDGCGATDTQNTVINIVNPALEIEIGEDIYASCIDNTAIAVDILSGSGGYQYEYFVADTSYAITSDIVVQSFNTIPVSVNVTDGCGGFATDELLYIIPDIPLNLVLSADTAICAGDGISISALASGGEEGFYYYWPLIGQFGPDQYVAPYSTTGYEVIATDICGHTISGTIGVEVQFLFSNFYVEDLEDNLYQFTATPEPDCDGCIYSWYFGDGDTSDEEAPFHQYDGLGDYTASLTVTNSIGCTDSAYTNIVGPIIFYVPNAFSPNNDGINDVFRAYGSGISEFEITIFNRWGDIVFTSTNIEEFWDGSDTGGSYYVQNEVYSYILKIKGNNTDGIEQNGSISVLR